MNDILNNTKKELLKEFIENAKSTSAIKTANMYSKQLEYDFNFGNGESIELLNRYFYQILSQEDLTRTQIMSLAKEIIRRENKWELAPDLSNINPDDIIEDGNGYVILSDGHRFDIEPDMYRKEREEYNNKREARLRAQKTNGKEYLR